VQDFVVFLAAHQIKVAGPIKSNSGDVTLKLNGRPAVLSCRLKGSPVAIPSITQCHVIGEELGRSHRKSVDHSYLRKKNVIDWCVSCADALGNTLSNEDQKLVNSVLKTFKNIPWYKLPAGPIHADLFPDNALFVDDELQGVIDFYHSCDAPFIFDLAVMLNAWCYSESVGCFYPVKEMTIPSKRTSSLLCLRAEVHDEVWQQLENLEFKTYAPESESSRLKGAGAGVTDND
jgi:homoserine kinase type II